MKGLDFLWLEKPEVDPGFGFFWSDQTLADLKSWAQEQQFSGVKAIALSCGSGAKMSAARRVLQETGLESYLFEENRDSNGRSQINLTSFSGDESGVLGVLCTRSLGMPPSPRWNGWFVPVLSVSDDEDRLFGRLLYWAFRHRVESPTNRQWRIHPHGLTSISDVILRRNIFESCAQASDIKPRLSVVIPVRLSRSSVEDVLTVVENIVDIAGQYDGETLVVVNEETGSAWSQDLVTQAFEEIRSRYPMQVRLVYAEAMPGVFCAGAARNLGASLARGSVLAFVDGDTLPNREWFEDVLSRHRQPGSFSVGIRQNHPKVQYELEPYWADFNRSAQMKLAAPNGWKYVCSHSLAMNKSDWDRYGGFAWPFQSYGYEDTELGYRLSIMGLRRELAAGQSIHFDMRDTAESASERRHSLRKAGGVFFGSYPCMEIAHHAFYLFRFPWWGRIGESFRSIHWRLKRFYPSGYVDHTHTR